MTSHTPEQTPAAQDAQTAVHTEALDWVKEHFHGDEKPSGDTTTGAPPQWFVHDVACPECGARPGKPCPGVGSHEVRHAQMSKRAQETYAKWEKGRQTDRFADLQNRRRFTDIGVASALTGSNEPDFEDMDAEYRWSMTGGWSALRRGKWQACDESVIVYEARRFVDQMFDNAVSRGAAVEAENWLTFMSAERLQGVAVVLRGLWDGT